MRPKQEQQHRPHTFLNPNGVKHGRPGQLDNLPVMSTALHFRHTGRLMDPGAAKGVAKTVLNGITVASLPKAERFSRGARVQSKER